MQFFFLFFGNYSSFAPSSSESHSSLRGYQFLYLPNQAIERIRLPLPANRNTNLSGKVIMIHLFPIMRKNSKLNSERSQSGKRQKLKNFSTAVNSIAALFGMNAMIAKLYLLFPSLAKVDFVSPVIAKNYLVGLSTFPEFLVPNFPITTLSLPYPED